MEIFQIRDPGRKKVGSRIRDKHPGSATVPSFKCNFSSMLLYDLGTYVYVFEPLTGYRYLLLVKFTWYRTSCF
jgi:hypothetical protein